MSADQAQPLILAIGSKDDFLHVYRNDKELLADNTIGAGPGELSGPIEFFDTDGHRLTGVYDRQWRLLQLTPTTSRPNLPALLRRVGKAINHLRSFIEDHPEESAEFGTEVANALQQLPRLRTSADLRRYLQTFVAHPAGAETGVSALSDSGPDIIKHAQAGFHNLAHRAGWNHG
ncbi:MAG: hypothetical protein ACRDTT_20540 [Pseudonocardiaceae bacterium]